MQFGWKEPTAARPKSGRPLQNQLPATGDGFVEATPSRVVRDGVGTLFLACAGLGFGFALNSNVYD
jgi:hypothetical protein